MAKFNNSIHTVKSKTNYIFTFGNAGVGKSTLLTSLLHYLIIHPVVNLIPNSAKNTCGFTVLIDWLRKLQKNTFPKRTDQGDIIQVEVAFKGKLKNRKEGFFIPVSILEMSGEDLNEIDAKWEDRKIEKPRMKNEYLKFVINATAFILVTSVDDAEKDDLLMYQFMNILTANKIKKPVALVISQWDKIDKDNQLDDFIAKKMPITYSQINKGFVTIQKTNKFEFSIGDVDEPPKEENSNKYKDGKEAKILKRKDDYCRPIVDWLIKVLIKENLS